MIKRYTILILFALLSFGESAGLSLFAQAGKFVVVIDAGHGGHDPGAIGSITKEKHINLNIALKLGQKIEKGCPGVKVIYTRKRDVFIPLDRRAQIANDAKADLFISIHTNALPKGRIAQGASTWTLGLARSQANLDVAKRENSVILYEDDYKTRYAGFNPNSAESYIIFEFMQDRYMSQSVKLASLVQKKLKSVSRRIDKGVHQAGFLVLKASAMPSILVEVGFITTPAEERFLNSSEGVEKMAEGIYQAFIAYRSGQGTTEKEPESSNAAAGQKSEGADTERNAKADADTAEVREQAGTAGAEQPARKEKRGTEEQIVFKVQFMTSMRILPKNDRRLRGLENVEYFRENGIYKYTCGATTDYNRALRTRRNILPRFKDAFIIAFRGEQKMNINEAIRCFKKKK